MNKIKLTLLAGKIFDKSNKGPASIYAKDDLSGAYILIQTNDPIKSKPPKTVEAKFEIKTELIIFFTDEVLKYRFFRK